MRVVSQLADFDLEVGSVRREGDRLVVRSTAGEGVDATVYVSARDAVKMLGAILRSPGAWIFGLLLPVLVFRSRRNPAVTRSDPNNPWN